METGEWGGGVEKRGRGTGCEFGDGGEAKPCVDPCSPPPHPSFSLHLGDGAGERRGRGHGG